MFKYIYNFQGYKVDVLLEKLITNQFSGHILKLWYESSKNQRQE